MSRNKQRKLKQAAASDRSARISKLLAVGWITDASEIPVDAIPVDPDRINLGGSYFHPIYFQAVEFICVDCGATQTWQAEDQCWYYETTGAPYYSIAKRCRDCRKREQNRKQLARISAGHEPAKVKEIQRDANHQDRPNKSLEVTRLPGHEERFGHSIIFSGRDSRGAASLS